MLLRQAVQKVVPAGGGRGRGRAVRQYESACEAAVSLIKFVYAVAKQPARWSSGLRAPLELQPP